MPRTLGPLFSSWSLEQAARGLLYPDRGLLGAYLDEISRQVGQAAVRVERPRSVTVRERASRFADEQLPTIILVCPGTIGEPQRDGEGLYSATWQMTVAAVSQATDPDIARAVASDLCVAATAVLLHELPRLPGVVSAMWAGEAADDVPIGNDQRSRAIMARGIEITVQDIVCDLAGLPDDWDTADPPMGQPPLDTGDLQTVLSAGLTVEPVEQLP